MSANGNDRRTSDRDNWETPQPVFERLNREFGFTFDVCADGANHKVPGYFQGPHDGGLRECFCGLCSSWQRGVCWMNPPYSAAADWIHKAIVEAEYGATVVALVPNATDNRWFETVMATADEVRFVTGRIQFKPPADVEGEIQAGTRKRSGNTAGSMVIVWRPFPDLRESFGPRVGVMGRP